MRAFHLILSLGACFALLVGNPATAAGAPAPEPASSITRLDLLALSGDHEGVEAYARQLLAVAQAKSVPSASDTAAAYALLGDALLLEERMGDAETAFEQARRIDNTALEPSAAMLATTLSAHGEKLIDAGRLADAEQLYRRAAEIGTKAGGEGALVAQMTRNTVVRLIEDQGRFRDAERYAAQALAEVDRKYGRDGPSSEITAVAMNGLAGAFWDEGRLSEAEALYRSAVEIDSKIETDPELFVDLAALAAVLEAEGRMSEAAPIADRALELERTAPQDQDDPTPTMDLAAKISEDQGQVAKADALYQAAAAQAEKTGSGASSALERYGQFLVRRERFADAEKLFNKAISAEKKLSPDAPPAVAALYTDLGEMRLKQQRFAEAERLFSAVLKADLTGLRAQHPITARTYQNLGDAQLHQDKFAAAVESLRNGCPVIAGAAAEIQVSLESKAAGEDEASACMQALTRALWGLAEKNTAADHGGALFAEAFADAQQSMTSTAGDAMAQASARTIAAKVGAGDTAAAYEQELRELDTLNLAFAKALGGGSRQQRDALAKARDDADARVQDLRTMLATKAATYWDYRSPSPLSLASLQSVQSDDAVLLHRNEALVVWMVPPGQDKGVVFAVSKTGAAWADIGLTGDDLTGLVDTLRVGIDPESFGRAARQQGRPQPFDRTVAHNLYLHLLGDAKIQAVINAAGIDTLIIVPSGDLTSLPPSLLVVDAPKGSDDDPAALAQTHWLIADKAIAVLPAVSSLRTLRQVLIASRTATDRKLLAFADPDFAGTGVLPEPASSAAPLTVTPPPAARGFERDGRGTDELKTLPPLYGSLAEGRGLANLIDPGDPSALLLGPDASKTNLLKRAADGSLAHTQVLVFSTHGLLTGDFTGLTEPALALAAPPKSGADPSDDGLLKASDAAALTLSADWVVLSACNTAGGQSKGAPGLSGLARAFFHAGASTLLVSHWRVDDDATAQLTTATFRERAGGKPKAKALQAAILGMIRGAPDDQKASDVHRYVEPRYWAPFVVVGEPE
ncbi:MAG TPA: CHAT domain-containing tetratricopeptide repeat protein [Caulobacteraceae bacterium]|jgi:CHAT domain-containing protein|nr:CHAT domain-containing tetratricopeptide repeat protein [Caulobacteraceae bacterium]